jgi:RIO kinase 1
MRILYVKGKMVHADLSEFNILMKGYVEREVEGNTDVEIEPIMIDMGQSLLLDHPNAEKFFTRDVKNVTLFFNKLGLDYSEDDVMKRVK